MRAAMMSVRDGEPAVRCETMSVLDMDVLPVLVLVVAREVISAPAVSGVFHGPRFRVSMVS
jgi:hypothetical protein